MKNLANLTRPINNQYGQPFADVRSSVGYLLVGILGSITKCTPNEKMEAYRLAMALRDADTFTMEESEVKLCLSALNNSPEVPAYAYAQIVEALKGVEGTDATPKPVQPAEANTPATAPQPQA